jgi:hypothetical protein
MCETDIERTEGEICYYTIIVGDLNTPFLLINIPSSQKIDKEIEPLIIFEAQQINMKHYSIFEDCTLF